MARSERDADQGQATSMEYQKELIGHLSKEIETYSKLMMDWRARASFYWLLGPFVVIGSVLIATKQLPTLQNLDRIGTAAAVVACGCFLAMAYLGARMEEHLWNQCNTWRKTIVRLTTDKKPALQDADFLVEHRVKLVYMLAHSLVLVAFLCSILLISRLALTSPEGNSGAPSQAVQPVVTPSTLPNRIP